MSTDQDLVRDRVQSVNKSSMVELLGQPGVEGYSETFYHPGNDKSGATIGNGIDFGHQDINTLTNAGLPPYLVKKIKDLKILGLTGKKAAKRIQELGGVTQGYGLTSGEVALISNQITQVGIESIAKKIGIDEWNNKPEGAKAVALSLKHIYGNKWYRHKSFKQFNDNDWGALKHNMQDYGDKTPGLSNGVNNRHRIMSEYLPKPVNVADASEYISREEARAEEQAEMLRRGAAQRFIEDKPPVKDPKSLYTTDEEEQLKPKTILLDDPKDIFYMPGGRRQLPE